MTYRTDQWFDLFNRGDETGEGLDLTTAANPAGFYLEGEKTNRPFIYPDRLIRNMAGSDNRPDGSFVGALKRGYIRNLPLGASDDSLGSSPLRCQFQFNPATILQNVSQAAGVLNFLQMEPAQFAQSLPGSNSFAFEILFDRSMELNNYEPPSELDLTQDDLWAQLSPETGGVLHDLSRLYSVIGVGLSPDLVEYATQVYARQAEAEASTMVQSGEDTTTLPTLDENLGRLETDTNLNIGNSAILMPLPVRVVFSSLYVIEGLVGGIQVRFSKFNHAMIPMQCGVSITMQAMYVGFARKKTFFSEALEALANYERLEPAVDTSTSVSPDSVVADVPAEVKIELSAISGTLFRSGDSKGKTPGDDGVELPYITTSFASPEGIPVFFDGRDVNTTLKLFWPKVNLDATAGVGAAIKAEELKVAVDSAKIKIYRYLANNLGANPPTDPLELQAKLEELGATTDRSADTQVRNIYARQRNTGDYDFKIPDVMLIREVTLDAANVGGNTPGVVSASTVEEAGKLFGIYAGSLGGEGYCYSIEQKGFDDSLITQGSSEIGYIMPQATEGADGTDKVHFLVYFSAKISITDKNGVTETQEGKSAFVVSSQSLFNSKQIKFENIPIAWNESQGSVPPGSFSGKNPEDRNAEETSNDAERAFETDSPQVGTPF